MSDGSLEVLATRDSAGGWQLRSPGVGVWSGFPAPGEPLSPGDGVGHLRRLNRRIRLVLPQSVRGRLSGDPPAKRAVPVEYGQLLLELVPALAEAGTDGDDSQAANVAALASDQLTVVSPTDGVFYSRAAPDAPPLVKLGDRVRLGQPLALVEVMKTLHQIQFEGAGFPDQAEVIEIRARDLQEVRSGAVLFVLRS